MNVTSTPAPKSSVLLEVEVPADRLDREVGEAVRRLSRRTRVPGFRPGKAPRSMLERTLGEGVVLDEAVEHLVEAAYREALIETSTVPLARASIEVIQAEEGKPVVFKATVPVPPEVALGDYRGFPFTPEIDDVDDAKVDKVLEELTDQQARLDPVEGRGARDGDYAVVGFAGTRDGVPFEGGTAERAPLILGEERFIPGFEEHILGLSVGDATDFEITFPADYPEPELAGQTVRFDLTLKELREKVAPPVDDEFARSMGDYADLASLRDEVRRRLERNALDRARHRFADRIIEYAVANATVDPPDVLVDEEVEVMHDEMRTALARQGISEEAYLKAVGKTEAELHAEMRPDAEKRVKTLLVLSKVADEEGVVVPPEAIEAEVEQARARYASDPKLVEYAGSDRARASLRSTMRRSLVVERLVDGWLADHPEHPAIPHAEDDPGTPAADMAAADVTAAADLLAADEAPTDPEPEPPGDAPAGE
jgi:trigger factor